MEPARGKKARPSLGENAEAGARREKMSNSLGRGQREGRSGGGASGVRRRGTEDGPGGARGGAAANYAKAPPAWPA